MLVYGIGKSISGMKGIGAEGNPAKVDLVAGIISPLLSLIAESYLIFPLVNCYMRLFSGFIG